MICLMQAIILPWSIGPIFDIKRCIILHLPVNLFMWELHVNFKTNLIYHEEISHHPLESQ